MASSLMMAHFLIFEVTDTVIYQHRGNIFHLEQLHCGSKTIWNDSLGTQGVSIITQIK